MLEQLQNPFFVLFAMSLLGALGYVIPKEENIPAFLFLLFASLGALLEITDLGRISLLKAVLLPFLILVLMVKRLRRGQRLPIKMFILLGVYMMTVYVSGVLNGVPLADYRGELGILLLAAAVSLAPRNMTALRRLTLAIAVWGIINAMVVITSWMGLNWAAFYGDIYNEGGRAVGLMRHSTFMGIYFAIALVAIQILYMDACNSIARLFWLGLGFIVLIGLLNAMSRGAFAGWLLAFLFIQYRLKDMRLGSILGILMLGGGILVLADVMEVGKAMKERFINMEQDSSAQARIPLIISSFNTFMQKPIIGNGVGWENVHMRLEAHNTFMQVLVESGIAGFLLFVALMWKGGISLLRRAMRKPDDKRDKMLTYEVGFAAMLGTVIFGGLTHSFDFLMPYWLLLGVGFMM